MCRKRITGAPTASLRRRRWPRPPPIIVPTRRPRGVPRRRAARRSRRRPPRPAPRCSSSTTGRDAATRGRRRAPRRPLRRPRRAARGLNAARNTGAAATDARPAGLRRRRRRGAPRLAGRAAGGADAELPDDVGVLTGPIRARFEDHALRACGREGPPITFLDLGPADARRRRTPGARTWRSGAARSSASGRFDEARGLYGDEQEWQARLRAAGGRHALRRRRGARPPPRRRRRAPARALRAPPAAAGAPAAASTSRGAPRRRCAASCACSPAARAHGLRFRCANGTVLAAHSAGRLRALAGARAPRRPPARRGVDDFLSGASGTVGGRRGALLRVARRAARRRGAAAAPRGCARPPGAAAAPARARPRRRAPRACPTCSARPRRAAPQPPRRRRRAPRAAGRAGKFENLNALLAGVDLAAVDWLLVVDDDVDLPRGFLDVLLHVAEARGPAARPARPPPALPRRVGGHAPAPRRGRARTTLRRDRPGHRVPPRHLRDAAAVPARLRMGWGLDVHWAALARERGWPHRRRRRHAGRPHAAPGRRRLPARGRGRRGPRLPRRPPLRARATRSARWRSTGEGRRRRGVLPARPRPGAGRLGPPPGARRARRGRRRARRWSCTGPSPRARPRRAARCASARRLAAQPRRATLDGARGPLRALPRPAATGPLRRAGARWAAPTLAVALRSLRRRFAFDLVHAHNAVPAGRRRAPRRGSAAPLRRLRATAPTSSTPPAPRRPGGGDPARLRRARGSSWPTAPGSSAACRALGATADPRRPPRHRPADGAPSRRRRRPRRSSPSRTSSPASATPTSCARSGCCATATRRCAGSWSATGPSARRSPRSRASSGSPTASSSPASSTTPEAVARARGGHAVRDAERRRGLRRGLRRGDGRRASRRRRAGGAGAGGARRARAAASGSCRRATPRRSPPRWTTCSDDAARAGAGPRRARHRRGALHVGGDRRARRSRPTRTRCAPARMSAPRPVLVVTNHVPPDRAGAFAALHAREGIELALFGGRSHHATAGLRGPRRPPPPRRQRDVLGLAAGGRYRAVVAGTAGRVALPAAWRGRPPRRRRRSCSGARCGRTRARRRTVLARAAAAAIVRDADAVVTYGPHVAATRSPRARGPSSSPRRPSTRRSGRRRATRARGRFGAPQVAFAGREAPEKGGAVLRRPGARAAWAPRRGARPLGAADRAPRAASPARWRSAPAADRRARRPRRRPTSSWCPRCRPAPSASPGGWWSTRPCTRHDRPDLRRRRRGRRRPRPRRPHRARRPGRRRRRAGRRAAAPGRRPRAARPAGRGGRAQAVAAHTFAAWARGFSCALAVAGRRRPLASLRGRSAPDPHAPLPAPHPRARLRPGRRRPCPGRVVDAPLRRLPGQRRHRRHLHAGRVPEGARRPPLRPRPVHRLPRPAAPRAARGRGESDPPAGGSGSGSAGGGAGGSGGGSAGGGTGGRVDPLATATPQERQGLADATAGGQRRSTSPARSSAGRPARRRLTCPRRC